MWNQSVINKSINNHVADFKEEQAIKQNEDSGIVDSGFLSSENFVISTNEISCEFDKSTALKAVEEYVVEGTSTLSTEKVSETKADSGLDSQLSNSLSQINLNRATFNSPGKPKIVEETSKFEPTLEPVVKTENEVHKMIHQPNDNKMGNHEDETWKKYFMQNDIGNTSLHSAIIGCHELNALNLIRLAPYSDLLNVKNDNGMAPLHLATLKKQIRVVRRLIIGGADPLICTKKGNTALHLACAMGQLNIAKVLTEPLTVMERHYLGPQATRVAPLPQNLEETNYQGQMCTHICATYDKVDLLRYLLRIGANLESRDGLAGRTVLHVAVECQSQAVLQFLLHECRPNLDAETYAGFSAYQLALCRDLHLARRLVQLGATPEPLPETDSEHDDSNDDENSSDEDPNDNEDPNDDEDLNDDEGLNNNKSPNNKSFNNYENSDDDGDPYLPRFSLLRH